MTNKTVANEKRFDTIDQRLLEVNRQLDHITTVVIKGFEQSNQAIVQKANTADIQRVLGLLDTLIKRQEISDDERLVMAHQLKRLHDWVEQAAQRIDLKFAR